MNKDNCYTYKKEDLELPGDVSYGVEKQFSYQARTALRLAHFLSNFLQVSILLQLIEITGFYDPSIVRPKIL